MVDPITVILIARAQPAVRRDLASPAQPNLRTFTAPPTCALSSTQPKETIKMSPTQPPIQMQPNKSRLAVSACIHPCPPPVRLTWLAGRPLHSKLHSSVMTASAHPTSQPLAWRCHVEKMNKNTEPVILLPSDSLAHWGFKGIVTINN
jgi:hypothetical protein